MTPIATTFVWLGSAGWTGRATAATWLWLRRCELILYCARCSYYHAGAYSSSSSCRSRPLLLFLRPPTAPHLVVHTGGLDHRHRQRRWRDGVRVPTRATPIAHSAPPETTPYVPALPVPTPSTVALVGLTVSPTTARYSFSYGGASSLLASGAIAFCIAPPHLAPAACSRLRHRACNSCSYAARFLLFYTAAYLRRSTGLSCHRPPSPNSL